MKKITIMIPTYNQAKYISKTIESALSIDYENLEVIVSDDCSTDNTEEVISKYLSDDRFKYIKNEKNLGRVGNYRKTLYEYATGDYVLNLDGDDWLLETEFFYKAVNLFDENEKLSCVFGDRKNYDEYNNFFKNFSNKNNPDIKTIMDGNDFFINMPRNKFIFSHLACLYKRELALKLDFYSKNILSSDSESICKLYINQQVGYLPIMVGVWREHDVNASHSQMFSKIENLSKYDSLYTFAKKNSQLDKKDLEHWLEIVKVSTLSQDFIYYLKQKQFKDFFKFFILSIKYDFKLSCKSLLHIFKRILNDK